jgi:hypothetical protein
MRTEFRAIVQSEYGAPERVLSIGSDTGTNIYSLAPYNLALKSVSILSWFRLAEDEKRKDFELALGSQ